MSSYLFNLYMYSVVREVNVRTLGVVAQTVGENERKWQVNRLLLTNDTALVAGFEEQMRSAVVAFGRV